jgi:tetratricopeptide (TPR) repeat protein
VKRTLPRSVAIALLVGSLLTAALLIRKHRGGAGAIEPAYAALAEQVASAKRPDLATRVTGGCVSAPDVCRCIVVAGSAALDADLSMEVLDFLEKAGRKCSRPQTFAGIRAEAMARAGRREEAGRIAEAASPDDEYAHLAVARLACDADQMTKCRESAQRALSLGRGAEADRLIGRTFLAQGEYQQARDHFRRLLEVAPRDLEAAFTAAVCSDRLGQYHEAREGFLRVLQVDPAHVNARIHLIALTANAGALDEARHHLSKLEALLPPGDPALGAARGWVESAVAGSSPLGRTAEP